MGNYSKAKGRSKSTFVMLRHDIMKSAAWRSLSPNAKCVWLEIMFRYKGDNNGDISLSCREAAEFLGIGKNTAHRAFIELEDRGFIKVGVIAGFNNKQRMATRWIVTHENHNGKSPTNEWRQYEAKI